MQARYYDPVLGRFMSHDPVGFIEGGVGYHNRYAYTANNPINAVDPDGEFWNIAAGAVIGAVVNASIYAYQSTSDGTFTWTGLAANGVEGGVVGGIVATGNVNAAIQAGAYLNISERLITAAAEERTHGNGALDRYTDGDDGLGGLVNATLTVAGDGALGATQSIVGLGANKVAPAVASVVDDIAGSATDDVITNAGRQALASEAISRAGEAIVNDIVEKEQGNR